MADGLNVRIVRCPRCENLLPEPLGLSVYKCGGCGTILKAKKKVPTDDGFVDKLYEKKDFGSSEKLEDLSEQGGSSVSCVSDSEWDNSIMESSRKERVSMSRRTYLSNSPIGSDDKEDFNDYEMESEKEIRGVWPMQRTADKEIGLVDNRGQFSEQQIENWVRRYNPEKEMSLYDSDSLSTAPYGNNTIGMGRSRPNFGHQRVERDAFVGYPGNSMAVADRQRVPNFAYPSERASSSDSDLFYGQHEAIGNYDDPMVADTLQGMNPNQAELLRRLDELKMEIIRSSDVGDKPRVITDRAPIGPYNGRTTNNVSVQSYTQNSQSQHRLGTQYLDQGKRTVPLTGHHQRNSEDFLYPPRHVVKDVPLYEDPLPLQMTRKAHYPPTHQYPTQLSREDYPESFMDFKQDPLPSHAQDAFFHHPACSCPQCSRKNRQGPLQASNSPISNIRNPKETIESSLYHNENPVTIGVQSSNPQSVGRFPPQDMHPHSRQPTELDSDMDRFALGQPRKAAVLPRNGKFRDAIAGGSPFVVCSSCLELLKLPRKLYKLEKGWQRVQCGACSVVFTVKVENKKFVISVPAETKVNEVSPDDSFPQRLTANAIATNSCLENSDNSSDKLTDTEHIKPSEEHDLNSGESEEQELTTSSISSKKEDIPASNCVLKDFSVSAQVPPNDVPSPTNSHSPSEERSDHLSDHEISKCSKESEIEQNSVISVSGATEVDFSFDDYSNTQVSQDSVEISKEEEEEDQNKISKESEPFFVGLSDNNLRDFSRSSEIVDSGKASVSVNGQPLPAHVVKKAEKLAGPILPGDYWYDYQAGFWGVMGHSCLGIIPPFIEEFTYPMPRNCAAGNTGIYVNGRELHKMDLDLLSNRGLPTTRDKFYRIDISGRVVDEDSGKALYNLGKLAPTIDKVKHGFGMKVPRSLK